MASGYRTLGVDLDSLFMARVNAKRGDCGFKVAGVDISNRYETIGSGTPISNTGFKSVGVDLAALFRNINQPLGTTYALTSAYYDTGFGASFMGYSTYWGIGSLSPTTCKGQVIQEMQDLLTNIFGDPPTFILTLVGNLAQSFFTSIVINGHTYLSSAATYYPGDDSTWRWSTPAGLANGGVYAPVIS